MKYRFLIISLLALSVLAQSCKPGDQNPGTADTTPGAGKTLILAIDGGGIKGIIPAYVLSQIEAGINNTKSYQLFDVIGGTSTGGIISIGLTTPFNPDKSPRTAAQILDIYLQDCGEIFYKNQQETILGTQYGPSYYADSMGHGVEAFLISLLGPTNTLSAAAAALPTPRVQQMFTTAYLVNSTGGIITNPAMGVDFGPYLFNWQDAKNDPTQDYYLWEAARSTSAAPTYFPLANVGGGQNGRSAANEKWAIDGGVMSNDPAMWAIAESFRNNLAQSLDDIVVISLGCGLDGFNGGLAVTNEEVNDKMGQKYGFWGDATWVTPFGLENLNGDDIEDPALLEVPLYANQFAPAAQLEILAANTGLTYYRIQPPLPADLTPMDDCANISALQSFVVDYFSQGAGKAQLDEVIQVISSNQ